MLATRLARSGAGEAPAGASGLYDVKAGAKDARNLFAFSIAYLFSLFAALLVERLAGVGAARQMSDPFEEGPDASQGARRRSLVIALALGVFVSWSSSSPSCG